ncbi:MAG: hypothetical protein M1353_08550 [Nitrospirae bacterium]|nr:hypothetical protein [Nitrospirota bacterium]
MGLNGASSSRSIACINGCRPASGYFPGKAYLPGIRKVLLFQAIILMLFVYSSFSWAESGRPPVNLTLPEAYGEVVYRCNQESPNHLYIIGMSHRDTLSRSNGSTTARAQAEAYKIGEWLVKNEMLELLLPEGFFKKAKKLEKGGVVKIGYEKGRIAELLDIKEVEKKLSDDSIFINAEILLKENYFLKLQQIEDRKLYDAVVDGIYRVESSNDDLAEYNALKAEMEYLQQRRTAAMLQRIPEVIEDEFRQGNIKRKKALLTIGLNHIHEIIKYLKENKITINAPLINPSGNEDYNAELNLLKEHFGITVIIPKTLADNQDILIKTRLDKVIEQSRGQSPIASFPLMR